VGLVAIGCASQAIRPIAFAEPPAARMCAEWATHAFASPSRARDEAFIDCIAKRNPSFTSDELNHRLEAGKGNGLFERLMSGGVLPVASESECPFLRVAVQSPAGSDDSYQKPMRDLFSEALTQAGFQVVDGNALHQWWASSLALETDSNSTAWTVVVRAEPEIGNGGIQFTSVQKTVSGHEGSFSGMQSLRVFSNDDAPEVARLAAEGIARDLLPAAHRRCDDIDTALEEARMRLEQLRRELAEEIQQVRREKARRNEASRQKQLEIEVEG
jgi:hypothetical protein